MKWSKINICITKRGNKIFQGTQKISALLFRQRNDYKQKLLRSSRWNKQQKSKKRLFQLLNLDGKRFIGEALKNISAAIFIETRNKITILECKTIMFKCFLEITQTICAAWIEWLKLEYPLKGFFMNHGISGQMSRFRFDFLRIQIREYLVPFIK